MKNKLNWLEAALLIAPFVVLAATWNKLPARFPAHWNASGEIDRWTSNRAEVLILPVIMLAVVALLHALPSFDPRLRKTLQSPDRMHTVLRVFSLVLAAFSAAIFALQMAIAFGYSVSAGRLVIGCTLVLLAVIGNYLGNLRPNYFAGIRTPWTLESPATWRATHRLGGRLICFGALLLLALQFVLSRAAFRILFVSSILLLVAWAFVYSWRHFQTHAASHEP